MDVLRIDEVARPVPAADQVLVEVVAAGINPGEASIRSGLLHERWPATFPSGQSSDFAGRVVDAVREAYSELAARHTRGKIVLAIELPANAGRLSSVVCGAWTSICGCGRSC